MTLMNDTALGLGKRLRAARLLADLDQAQLADRIHAARQTVSNWERGVGEPSVTYFVRWAAATGQPLDWFAEAVNAERAPSVDEALAVHPPGLEPGTH